MGNRSKQQGYAPLTRRYRMDRMPYKMSEAFFSLFVFLVAHLSGLCALRCGESMTCASVVNLKGYGVAQWHGILNIL